MKKSTVISLLIAGMSFGFVSCDGGGSVSQNTSGVPPISSVSEESATSSAEAPVTSSVEKRYWSGTYSNPTTVINPSGTEYKSEVADPSIVRGDDGYFYIFSTNGVVLRSEDACEFELYSNQIIPTPTWWQDLYPGSSGFAIWAPDVVKVQDKWIYYYSLSAWGKCCGVGYAISDSIGGPYEDQRKLFDLNEIGIDNCIDPQVIVDDDGVYMAVGSFQGLFLLELTDDGMELLGGADYQKEHKTLIAGKVGGWDGSTYEGSYIIKKDGYYYYFGSAGTCCENQSSTYRVYVGRSESIYGPYVDSKRIPLTMSGGGNTYGELVLWAGTDADKPYAGPGHNSILMDDAGDFWIYYHAYSQNDNFVTRHLFMDKLSWSDSGWPYVSYYDEENDKEVKSKPSMGIELDGPRFEEV